MTEQLAFSYPIKVDPRDIERLALLAQELARAARKHGITIADLRITAVNRGVVLTGGETGRKLSFLGVVMRKARLSPTGEFRRSIVEGSHGNLHRVYVFPGYEK